MTTIACTLKEIAADSRVTWEGVGMDAASVVKLYAGKNGAVYGVTGEQCDGSIRAMEWLQGDRPIETKPHPPEYEHDWDWRIIELSKAGIAVYNELLEAERLKDTVMAVGSGRKVALYCMKYMRMSPAEAVREACRVDHFSEVPIYRASLLHPAPALWKPAPKKRTRIVAKPAAP